MQRKAFFIEQSQATIHNDRIESRPSSPSYLIQCRIDSQAGAIRAMGVHRFNHIGYGHNARFQQYVITFQPVWITGTIKSLMML